MFIEIVSVRVFHNIKMTRNSVKKKMFTKKCLSARHNTFVKFDILLTVYNYVSQ
jgi:hypothetical protein